MPLKLTDEKTINNQQHAIMLLLEASSYRI